MRESIDIVIGGEAGQGLVSAGELLSKVLVRSGYNIVVTQSYLSRIRGGHNTFSIRVSAGEIYAPGEGNDLRFELDLGTVSIEGRDLKIPYSGFGPKMTSNIATLGIAASVLGLGRDICLRAVDERFGKKGDAVTRENEKAFGSAYDWAEGQKLGKIHLQKAEGRSGRMMLCGNEAIALGAVSSGARFCSFYPMTPATTVSLNLISYAHDAGIIVEQAEDEIAAINMAIGASFAGAPSMVATSGGGFALMVEGVSLAGMTETPIVIVVAQRPGPATGLPTRTEQADLEFVLHSGHGEFPRAIFTPGTVEECFHLTRKAFELAEKYQGPVFVLTDQFLADSFRAVDRFDISALTHVKAGAEERDISSPYNRYALTGNGVSPRLIPGRTKHIVVAGSDEHTEDGHLTEDLSVRKQMVDKRLKKLEGLKGDALPPVYFGADRPDTLYITFGSTFGAVRELVGRGDAHMHFPQVWPLVPSTFIDRLLSAGRVVSVEGNATGQFARLIRRETGFEIEKVVKRYDGLPVTKGYILSGLGI